MDDSSPEASSLNPIIGAAVPKSRDAWIAERPQNQPKLLQLFESPDHLQAAVDRYFDDCKRDGKPSLWTGLALYLGFASRQSLWDYLGGHKIRGVSEEWLLPLQKAATRVEAGYEARLHEAACAGGIFALKQRGWTDVQRVEIDATVHIEHLTDRLRDAIDVTPEDPED